MRSRSEKPALAEAKRALRLGAGKADDWRPPPSTFPGRRVKPLPGQLDLDGNEQGLNGSERRP
jgi:hypothetical protein